ncbi:MAG: GNAT family N-acetyltransferase [Muribaculaceae bacterium]|nr:GNAT family N-acetyltransferase [Muribaculaceae bacterium]
MEEKIPFSDSDLTICRLAEDDYSVLSSFNCGDITIDKFIHEDVGLCYQYRYITPYKCVITGTNEIVGIFTLSNDVVILPMEEKFDICENIPEYVELFKRQPSSPAVNINHLAVREGFQRRGVGKTIVEFVRMTFHNYRQIGCQFLTVDALNIDGHRTTEFYEKLGFVLLSVNDYNKPTRRMYLPLF